MTSKQLYSMYLYYTELHAKYGSERMTPAFEKLCNMYFQMYEDSLTFKHNFRRDYDAN